MYRVCKYGITRNINEHTHSLVWINVLDINRKQCEKVPSKAIHNAGKYILAHIGVINLEYGQIRPDI